MARVVVPLTDTKIKNAKPKDKQFDLPDGNGLLLQVKPNGSKLWRFNYVKPYIKTRTYISLGGYPELSLSKAREIREEYRALLAQNIDPQEYRKKKEMDEVNQLENTLSKIAESWKSKKALEVSSKTMQDTWNRLNKHILCKIGDVPIASITPALLISVLKPVADEGKLETVHRIINKINEVLDFAVNAGLLDVNKCSTVGKAFPTSEVKNFAAITPAQLPKFLQDLMRFKITQQTKSLILWQMLTMVRPSEAAKAEWTQIDWDNKWWEIPASNMKKTKAGARKHIVPLSTQALKLLEKIHKETGNSRYLFPHMTDVNKHMSSETARSAISKNGYKGIMTAHGMRTLASTYLNELELNADVIEASLAHKIKGVRGVYNRATYLEQRKEIMQIWGDYVEKCSQISII